MRFLSALIFVFAFAGATGFARQPEIRHAMNLRVPQREPGARTGSDADHKTQTSRDPAREFSNPLKRRRMAMLAIPGGIPDFAF